MGQTSRKVERTDGGVFWTGHRSTIDAALPRGHTDAAYDPELYLRWLQWGAHAPILRTHPLPDPAVERRAWGYNLPFSEYMRSAFARRAQLVPLIYTALHEFEVQKRSRSKFALFFLLMEHDGLPRQARNKTNAASKKLTEKGWRFSHRRRACLPSTLCITRRR